MGQELELEWIKMKDVHSPNDDLRFRGFEQGAACFARGEGMWYSEGSVYFACTNGGKSRMVKFGRFQGVNYFYFRSLTIQTWWTIVII